MIMNKMYFYTLSIDKKKMVWLLKTNTIIKTKGESRIEILKLNSLSSRL